MINVWLSQLNYVQRRWAWLAWLMIAVSLAQVTMWALDRRVPYELLSYEATDAKRGGHAKISMQVNRIAFCELRMTRYVEDSKKFRHYIAPTFFGSDALRRLERESPGRANLVVEVPESMALGAATYGAIMSYRCNPVHTFWPVQYEMITKFQVVE